MSPSSQPHQSGSVARNAASGVVFLIGAGLYALLQRSGTVDFNATPVSVGVIAIIAGLVSSRRRAIATGLVLAGLYLSYDVGALGRWPAWALSLLALAGWELFWAVGPRSAREATAAR